MAIFSKQFFHKLISLKEENFQGHRKYGFPLIQWEYFFFIEGFNKQFFAKFYFLQRYIIRSFNAELTSTWDLS